jgi:hypothetical protein
MSEEIRVTEKRSEVVEGADANHKRLFISAPSGELLEARLNQMYDAFKNEEVESDSTDKPFEFEVIRVFPACEIEFTKVYIDANRKATKAKVKKRTFGLD